MTSYTAIGQPVPRIEGPDKVTGATRFASDVTLPGTLWCKLLRSPVPHARIVRVDTSRAAACPGVHAVLTGADLPPDTRMGRRMRDMPVPAWDHVRYVGDRVAAVAADDRSVEDEAAEVIHGEE